MASNEVSAEWPAFPTRLMALPAVSEACDLALHLYIMSKEYRVVGMALGVAESTLKSAATVAVPLTTPLLGYVERLKPLDDWACLWLDAVEKMMPAINKPTGEMLSATQQGVLVTVAGGDEPPATLAAALSTRACRIATSVKEQTVAICISVPHRLLDTAHSLLDHYLPEERITKQQPVERQDGMVVKTVALATKTSRRLCCAAHDRLHASCPLDPTPSHLAMECMQMISRKCPGRLVWGWQQQQPVVMLVLIVLPLRLTWATARILLGAVTILAEELSATWMKLKPLGQATVEQENGEKHCGLAAMEQKNGERAHTD